MALNDTHLSSVRHLVEIAKVLCEAPMACLSVFTDDRQWLVVKFGLEAAYVPREFSFCESVLNTDDEFELTDARMDSRFMDHPLVNGFPHVVSYWGMPLRAKSGKIVAVLSVMDRKPRMISDSQRHGLRLLVTQMESILSLKSKSPALRLNSSFQSAMALKGDLSQLNVLVFDSEVLSRRSFVEDLLSCGVSPRITNRADLALAWFARQSFDLVFLGQNQPNLVNFIRSLYQKAHQHECFPNVYVYQDTEQKEAEASSLERWIDGCLIVSDQDRLKQILQQTLHYQELSCGDEATF